MTSFFSNDLLAGTRLRDDARQVSHRAGRHKERGFPPENVRGAVLEAIDCRIFEKDVVPNFRFGHRPSHFRRGFCYGVASEVDNSVGHSNSSVTPLASSQPAGVSFRTLPSNRIQPASSSSQIRSNHSGGYRTSRSRATLQTSNPHVRRSPSRKASSSRMSRVNISSPDIGSFPESSISAYSFMEVTFQNLRNPENEWALTPKPRLGRPAIRSTLMFSKEWFRRDWMSRKTSSALWSRPALRRSSS